MRKSVHQIPGCLHIWMTLMSPEGCQFLTQDPSLCVFTVPLKRGFDPHAHCEKVTGDSVTSVCRHGTASPTQHPEVGTSLGASAPRLISIIVDEGLRLGLL